MFFNLFNFYLIFIFIKWIFRIVAEKVSRFISDQNNQVGDFLLLLQYDIHRTPVSTEGLKTPEDYLKLSCEIFCFV